MELGLHILKLLFSSTRIYLFIISNSYDYIIFNVSFFCIDYFPKCSTYYFLFSSIILPSKQFFCQNHTKLCCTKWKCRVTSVKYWSKYPVAHISQILGVCFASWIVHVHFSPNFPSSGATAWAHRHRSSPLTTTHCTGLFQTKVCHFFREEIPLLIFWHLDWFHSDCLLERHKCIQNAVQGWRFGSTFQILCNSYHATEGRSLQISMLKIINLIY